ncbi:MAG: hypothetical protein ACHQ01_04990 [Candidatus Limnocylindrales bacterium]
MAEEMVRCARCYQLYDPDDGVCPECGAPYQAPVEQPPAREGDFVDRYAGTEFAPPPVAPPPAPAPRRNNAGLLIGGGAALIVTAVVVAILFDLGALGGSGPTQAPFIFSATAPPSPTPTLPPTIASTLAQLSDPNLSAHVTVDSHTELRVLGDSQSISVRFDGEVSNGNQQGTLQASGITEELRLVDGHVYARLLPTGRWNVIAQVPAYQVICPLFGLSQTRQLQLIGLEMKDGQSLNHFQSTGWWTPDLSRMAMADLSGMPIKPDKILLDLWATPEGAPVEATFSGTNSATDGTKLLDIEVSYTFSDVGVQQSIGSPGPSPTVTPSSVAPPSQ